MRNDSEARLGTLKSWGRHVMKELASVERLLGQGIEFAHSERHQAVSELAALVEPHLPVLVHKRAKICGRAPAGTIGDARWLAELSQFVSRWPHLAASADELGAELDRIIAAEQKRLADVAESSTVPMTSRFDTSWAT